ncbi:MAG: hypothetical protein RSD96_01475 [Bacilli bacterium]
MKSIINHYYNLYPTDIKEENDNYYFIINDKSFVLHIYLENIKNLDDLVKVSNELVSIDKNFSSFIKTINNEFYIKHNDNYYCLLLINNKNKININTIVNFLLYKQFIKENTKKIDWNILWGKRVDEIEKKLIEYNLEYPLVILSASYYIGLAENAIAYFNNIEHISNNITLVHKRLNKEMDFYNPLNIMYDYNIRDISEYIISSFFKDDIDLNSIFSSISRLGLSSYDYQLLYSRLLYPSYYFDMIEKIMNDEIPINNLYNIIDKVSQYELLLKEVIIYIKSSYFIESIEWLE